MSSPIYVLDANVFIQASRRYYAFDIAPKFWESLTVNGNLCSIDRVNDELMHGNDELKDWAKNDFSHAFVSTDEEDITAIYAEIMTWVSVQSQFSDAAKADFARGADGWLVACAKAKNYVVVTHEVLSPDVKRKVPIPNVCQAFDVSFVDTFEMLRKIGMQFV